MRVIQYLTPHGITVTRTKSKASYRKGLRHLLRELDTYRGFYLSSGYEFPGRYSRWDFASTRPPVEILAFDRRVEFRALNVRGEILNQMFFAVLREHPHWESFGLGPGGLLSGTLKPPAKLFSEEERSKQPSVFSILRALIQEFHNEQDSRLGLIGAFGYRSLKRGSWRSRAEFIDNVAASWPEYNRLHAHPFEWTWSSPKMRRWVAEHGL
jgi:anthranilate synthase